MVEIKGYHQDFETHTCDGSLIFINNENEDDWIEIIRENVVPDNYIRIVEKYEECQRVKTKIFNYEDGVMASLGTKIERWLDIK